MLAAHNKKARQDTNTWMQTRLRLNQTQKDENAALITLFDTQLCLLFEIHGHLTDIAQEAGNSKDSNQTLTMQLGKLQKDTK